MEDNESPIDFPTEIVQEGEVQVIVPQLSAFVKSPSEYAPSKAPVFYNPVMELNRDIAVLALQAYQKSVNREISVCEPLASGGIRGIRFATEVEGVKSMVINDLNPKAFHLAQQNVHMNKLGEVVSVRNEDANFLLASYGAPHGRFDAVDLDPFGSPVPYVDSAIRSLRSGSLLVLTATDMGPLCGVHSKACIRKYGGTPLHTEYCKELAVRLLAGSLAMTAAQYDMGVKMVFSHSTDHYIRVYAILKHGAKRANKNIKSMGYVLHCFQCLHREAYEGLFVVRHPMRCSECGSKMRIAGPLWLGKLSDENFCGLMEDVVAEKPLRLGWKIRKLLNLVKHESSSPITYYVLDKISEKMGLPAPSLEEVIKKLSIQGMNTIRTSFDTLGIKTEAPLSMIKEAVQHPSINLK
ncbi:MAG: tRNA (guanine(10)-N(2))-dimethyltransferase [Thermoproteota archaeon]